MVMEPYAGVDYNLYADSRVNSNTFTMGIGQPYVRVDFNPMPELTLSHSKVLRIWPLITLCLASPLIAPPLPPSSPPPPPHPGLEGSYLLSA